MQLPDISVTEASRAPGTDRQARFLMVLIPRSRVAPAWTGARRDSGTGTERR
jgi:hypothetical protein